MKNNNYSNFNINNGPNNFNGPNSNFEYPDFNDPRYHETDGRNDTSEEPSKKPLWKKIRDVGRALRPVYFGFMIIAIMAFFTIKPTNDGIAIVAKPEEELTGNLLVDAWGTVEDIRTLINIADDPSKAASANSSSIPKTTPATPKAKKSTKYTTGDYSIGGSTQFKLGEFYNGLPLLKSAYFYSGNEKWSTLENLGLPRIDVRKDTKAERRLPGGDGSFSWRIPTIENPSKNIHFAVLKPEGIHQEYYALGYSDGRYIEVKYDGSNIPDGGGSMTYEDTVAVANFDLFMDAPGVYKTNSYIPNSAIVISKCDTAAKNAIIMVYDKHYGVYVISMDYSTVADKNKLTDDLVDILTGFAFESMDCPVKVLPYGRANLLVDEITLVNADGSQAVIDNSDHYIN
jgi:hypothetical protein